MNFYRFQGRHIFHICPFRPDMAEMLPIWRKTIGIVSKGIKGQYNRDETEKVKEILS